MKEKIEIITRKEAQIQGRQYYFTGKPCKKKQHLSERYVANSNCRECRKEDYYNNHEQALKNAKDYKEKNREKINKKWRESYKENPIAHKSKNLEYYYKNKELISQKSKSYYEKNKEQCRENAIEWYNKNKETSLKRIAKWQKNNSEKVKIFKANNRAKREKVEGKFTKEDIEQILKLQKNKCAYCKCNVSKTRHIDHIMPLSKGGTNWRNNLQILCPKCNLTKNAKDPIKFAQEIGKLL